MKKVRGLKCGAVPDTLLESKLFGNDPRVFTGANKVGGKSANFNTMAH